MQDVDTDGDTRECEYDKNGDGFVGRREVEERGEGEDDEDVDVDVDDITQESGLVYQDDEHGVEGEMIEKRLRIRAWARARVEVEAVEEGEVEVDGFVEEREEVEREEGRGSAEGSVIEDEAGNKLVFRRVERIEMLVEEGEVLEEENERGHEHKHEHERGDKLLSGEIIPGIDSYGDDDGPTSIQVEVEEGDLIDEYTAGANLGADANRVVQKDLTSASEEDEVVDFGSTGELQVNELDLDRDVEDVGNGNVRRRRWRKDFVVVSLARIHRTSSLTSVPFFIQ